MEVSGIALRPLPWVCCAGCRLDSNACLKESSLSGLPSAGSRSPSNFVLKGSSTVSVRTRRFFAGSEFSDGGHLQYYAVSPKSGGKKKGQEKEKNSETVVIKKRLKVVKALSRNLSAFSGMGFGIEADEGLAGEVKAKMISEATESLMAELQLLRAQEKEKKSKKKEEKAARKAARMKAMVDRDASSSSSESSDSECGEVVDMSCLRSCTSAEPKMDEPQEIQAEASVTVPVLPTPQTIMVEAMKNQSPSACRKECSSSSSSSVNGISVSTSAERIEVCMGGKCRKSGAVELLQEFERMVGLEGAVVGCKCMGKCRDGPNVRVRNRCDDPVESTTSPVTNPLCIGVGLDDVGAIVANFFGDKKKDVGLLAA